jgi:hypothetical protein
MTPVKIKIEEFELLTDSEGYPIEATKISFFNLGNIPVTVGLISIPPGDVYQVNYEHPHVLSKWFRIKFDVAATPAGASLRSELALSNYPRLIVQTMTPE